MTDEEIQAMADTYTEGYRIGFEVTGKRSWQEADGTAPLSDRF